MNPWGGFAVLLLAFASAHSGSACVLQGTVLDAETGKPVAKARVFAKPHADGMKAAILRPTNELGVFCFERLEAGAYDVVADRTGYVAALYGARPGGEQGWSLNVDSQNELPPLTLRLVRSATITGVVMGSNGEPTAGARVLLNHKVWTHGWEPEMVSSVDTDDSGGFRFNRLAPGTYYLSAESNGDRDLDENRQTAAALTFYRGSLTFARATPVSLQPGQQIANLVLTIERVATRHLSGKLSPSVHLEEASKLYLNSDNSGSTEVSVGKDGSFSVDGLLPAKYRWQVTRAKFAVGAEVDLTNGDVDDFVLEPQKTFDVRFSARVEGGAPIGQVQFYAGSLDQNPSTDAREESGGSYMLPAIVPGIYRLEAAPYAHLFVKALAIDGKTRPGGVLDLRQGQPGEVEAILSENMAKIEGRLVGPEGSLPALATTLVAMNETKSRSEVESVEAAVDHTGKCKLEWLEPGKYRLFAIEGFETDVWGSLELAAALRGKSLAVELHEGESKSLSLQAITFEEWSAALRRVGM